MSADTAIVAVGSSNQVDLVPLRLGQSCDFDVGQTIRLPGAHGDDVVRAIHVEPDVSFRPRLSSDTTID